MLDYPDVKALRFVLTRTGPGGEWLVFLDRPGRLEYRSQEALDYRLENFLRWEKGCGTTPELAYTDLLGKTADKLCVAYGLHLLNLNSSGKK